MTTALASAGSRRSASSSRISTRTLVPSGTTAVMEPTGTPSTRTELSSKTAAAEEKYAVTVRPGGRTTR